MDCEGCEFDVILNDYEHVRVFKEIAFEYHLHQDKKLSDLLKILRRDYHCRIIKKHDKVTGIVHCTEIT